MSQPDDVTHWIGELQAGNQEAQERIFAKYFGAAVRVAERKLGATPQREADGEDIALSAMNSFFEGVDNRQFPDVTNSNDLWRLLTVITARKAVQQTRRQYRKKRGGNTVRGESVFATSDGQLRGGLAEAAKADTAQVEIETRDAMQHLLNRLEDETLKQIALLKLQGYTNSEIAEQLNVVTRTVERKLARIRDCWMEEAQQ